ncbi:MAG: hypothetical protein AAFV95_24800 [Bacteroidota bacterium]
MFPSLPQYLRQHHLSADVRTLMLLRKSMEKGLVHTLGDLYVVLKGIVTRNPQDFGPFTTAFYDYFLAIQIRPGESLENAILRSETFAKWRQDFLKDLPEEEKPNVRELIDQFLNEVHFSSYDIQQMLSGEDVLRQDDPDRPDTPANGPEQVPDRLREGVDYSQLSLDELLERMRRVAEQQRRAHKGGRHWIGQGGSSPYGNQGAARGGIRVGGAGGGKMARKVIGDPNYYPVDLSQQLQDDNIDVALAYLKGIEQESAQWQLDVPQTIKQGVKRGGLFLPHLREKIDKKVQVLLLIDNGGWSMTGYIRNVTKLFSKMERRFAHDLKTYFYHNTIYGGAYSDSRRTKFEPMSKILSHDKNYSIFIIGDADMAPYELDESSLDNWRALQEHFPRCVWLNPMSTRYWKGSFTVNMLRKIFPMHPLSPEGIEKAVWEMNRKRSSRV